MDSYNARSIFVREKEYMDDDSLIPYSQTHLLVVIPVVCLATVFAFAWNPWDAVETARRPVPPQKSFVADPYLSIKAKEFTDQELKDIKDKQDQCLACHDAKEKPDAKKFKDGVKVPIAVDSAKFRASPHGKTIGCHTCHTGYEKYFEAGEHDFFPGSYKEFKTKAAETCGKCHASNAQDLASSAHGTKGGLTCVSCHGSHETGGMSSDPASPAGACAGCHKAIAAEYGGNVHAEALKKGVKTAPSCAGCHGSTHVLKPVGKGEKDGWAAKFRRDECADCHGKSGPDLGKGHDFLIPVGLHLSPKIGCACHSEKTGGAHILGRENQPVSGKTKKDICVMCHSKDGALAAAIGSGYVIGAKKEEWNRWIDIAGIAIILLTFAGLPLAHGSLRIMSGMMRKSAH